MHLIHCVFAILFFLVITTSKGFENKETSQHPSLNLHLEKYVKSPPSCNAQHKKREDQNTDNAFNGNSKRTIVNSQLPKVERQHLKDLTFLGETNREERQDKKHMKRSASTLGGHTVKEPLRLDTMSYYPFSATGDMRIQYTGNGTTNSFYCTGSVIGPELVLTAAECVWNSNTGDFYTTEIYFAPGQTLDENNNVISLGVWKVVDIEVPHQYKLEGNQRVFHNFALLRIERKSMALAPIATYDIGSITGTLGLALGGNGYNRHFTQLSYDWWYTDINTAATVSIEDPLYLWPTGTGFCI